MFSGTENLLHFDQQTGNLVNVYFGRGSNAETDLGVILDIKEHPDYGGEIEIYTSGEILILPWHPGDKPELLILGDQA